MERIAVLGAGMAGFGAAYRFHESGVTPDMYEMRAYPGGHTATYDVGGGFLFDDGPHISFTQDERIQEILAESVNGKFEVIQNHVNNYWQGHWIKHPAQVNLYGLPEDLIESCIRDFTEAQQQEPGEIRNYKDWLYAAFGKTFAETFPTKYGTKYHTTTPDNMSTEWLGPRLYRPDLDEVIRGARNPETPDVHYVTHFRYPSHGGFFSYLKRFIPLPQMHLEHKLASLDPKQRILKFENGTEVEYDYVMSSLPLPELIPRIEGAPADVRSAVDKLACTTCLMVNVGINRSDISENHWTYFYDEDFTFTRLSFPHMLSPNVVPPGAGSIQCECYYSNKYRPVDVKAEDCIEPCLRDLRRCGLLKDDDEILYVGIMETPYANVIFDLDRADALATVHAYLNDIGIRFAGRYADWGYHWTDESFKSGEDAAQSILDALGRS